MSRHTPLRQAFERPWPTRRRGLCLWLFAFAFMIVGAVNYMFGKQTEVTRESLTFAFDIAPPFFWGVCMALVGLFAMISSYCHFGRDRYGFVVLSMFCAGWGMVYLCGFFFYDASIRAVSGSIIWFLFSGILTLISGFPNLVLKAPPVVVSPQKGD